MTDEAAQAAAAAAAQNALPGATETPPETPPSSETPPETPPSETPPETPPADTRTPAEKRIQELVATNKQLQNVADAAKDYANFWRKRAEQGAALPDDVAAAEAAANQPKPAPKLEDFKGDTTKWATALQEWNTAEIQRGIKLGISEATTAATAAQSQAAAKQSYTQRVDEFKKTTPDFDDVIRTPGLAVSETMRDVIVASDIGPAVAHYLGKNVALSQQIYNLPKEQQILRMGEIVGTVRAASAQPTPPPPPPTPPPPTPIEGSAPASINLATASLDDYLKHRLGVRPPPP